MNEIFCALVGATFRPKTSQLIVVALQRGDHLNLVPEPTNKFDPNAVMVTNFMGVHIGYVNKDSCLDVLNLIENAEAVECTVASRIGPLSVTLSVKSVLPPDPDA